MDNITNEERIKEFNEVDSYCAPCDFTLESNYDDMYNEQFTHRNEIKAGKYTFVKLQYLAENGKDDFTEEDHYYLVDKNGVPYKVAEIIAGSKEKRNTTLEEYKFIGWQLDKIYDVFFLLAKSEQKPALAQKYSFNRELTEYMMDDCFKNGNFIGVSIDKVMPKDDYIKFVKAVEKSENLPEKYSYHRRPLHSAFCRNVFATIEGTNDHYRIEYSAVTDIDEMNYLLGKKVYDNIKLDDYIF